MSEIGESKKRIYTIPEGRYIGVWSGYYCKIGKDSFETKTGMKGTVFVIVIIEGTKAKIYEQK